MSDSKNGSRVVLWVVLVTVLALAIMWDVPVSAQQAGTTLTANKTATGHARQTFGWSISKSVSPAILTTSTLETGSAQYTIAVTKSAAPDEGYVDGQICVTNSGSLPTENLQIVDVVQYKVGSGQFQDFGSAALDLSAKPVLAAGESACYAYRVTFTPVVGATYRNAAQVTITNHAGWLPGGKNCPGSAPCPFGPNPRADFSLPGSPDSVANGTITVSDSNGSSWSFSDSGSVTYTKTFTCDAEHSTHSNVATILQTGQTASASIQVNCELPPDPGGDH